MAKRRRCITASIDRDERGADLIEYAMMIALVIFVALVAIKAFSNRTSKQFSDIGGVVSSM